MLIEGISFVIPTYNNSLQTLKCINSITSNEDTKKINYEIIIIDDFSNSENFLYLENKIQLFNDKKITIFKNNKNMGPSYSRNFGVKKAKFE